jgi:transcriptional regulator with XRE-family HTH domain
MTVTTIGVIPQFSVGDRLRKARELTGLDQGQFADEIGVSRGTIYNYENGRSQPKKVVLLAWQMRTGVPIEWLMHGIDPTTPAVTITRPPAPPTR